MVVTIAIRKRHATGLQLFHVQGAGAYCMICDKCTHRNLVSPNVQKALLCVSCLEPLVLPLDAHFACPARLEKQFAVMRPFDIEGFLTDKASELCNKQEYGDWATQVVVGFMDIGILHTGDGWGMMHTGGRSGQVADFCPADNISGSSNRRDCDNYYLLGERDTKRLWCTRGKRKSINSGSGGGAWRSIFNTLCLRTAKNKRSRSSIPYMTKKHILAVATDEMLAFYAVDQISITSSGSRKCSAHHQLQEDSYELILNMH
ncbi:hypothetical protein BX070DRAFT_233235 [Coemansia spiralis]|nr:hypothetical protein BX070DRAFT_233235 [Coemansia spiralis]